MKVENNEKLLFKLNVITFREYIKLNNALCELFMSLEGLIG